METTSHLLAHARRGLAAFCALSLVFSLSACGGDDSDEPAPPPTTTPAPPPAACASHCAP
ncbi:hypothetical protein [Achromobacter sp. UMC46]|uniref:hypothetical protein n=1 Tax=Achromobacter sp. UMC46 TaxID=1862319 RepID=UPI0016025A79|nr:hypothetical protein [Achromobacter sp. UMC46]